MKPTIYPAGMIGQGALYLMARPSSGERLQQEFAAIRTMGIDRIVSLLEPQEAMNIGLGDEQKIAEAHSMEFLSYPIPDMALPVSLNSFALFTRQLNRDCTKGVNTLVHCHAGIGRTGLIAAGVLLHSDYSAVDAFSHLSEKRGTQVPDTPEQYEWIVTHASQIVKPIPP